VTRIITKNVRLVGRSHVCVSRCAFRECKVRHNGARIADWL